LEEFHRCFPHCWGAEAEFFRGMQRDTLTSLTREFSRENHLHGSKYFCAILTANVWRTLAEQTVDPKL
jgi:hypothetical protein